MKVSVDAHEFNMNHHWELFLEDADGQPVRFDTPEGPQTIEVRGDFSAQAPEGVPAGTPVDIPIAVNFGPIPLAPGQRYTWRFVSNGQALSGGTVSFTTRPQA